MKTCNLCSAPHHARGFCPMHYRKWKRYGDPHRPEDYQERVFLSEYTTLKDYGFTTEQIAKEFGIQRDSLVTRLRRIEKRKARQNA